MKFISALLLLLLTLPLSASAQPSAPPAWRIDRSKSIIQFKGFKDGKPFATVFQSWNANIKFDPANPGRSSAIITIDTRSGSTGNRTFKDYLVAPSWYSPDKIPFAQFQTFSFRPMGNNIYEANGILRIYNKSQRIVLPFPGLAIPVQVTTQGNNAIFKSDFSFAVPDFSPGARKNTFKKLNFNMVLTAFRTPDMPGMVENGKPAAWAHSGK
jgi:polyisoprenoid-binding protein YceI